MEKSRPKRGDRFIVEKPFQATVLTQWRAPFTGGNDRTLPHGLEFVVEADPPEHATAVSAAPADPDKWASLLVDETDRTAEKYDGYSLVIRFEDLPVHCSQQA